MERCTIYVDGAAKGNPGPAGIGVAILDSDCMVFEGGRYVGEMTNNMAEYRALVFGLEKALEYGARHAVVFSDSELVVHQMNGHYRVRSERLWPLYEQAQALCRSLESFEIQHIPRAQNQRADALADRAIVLHQVKSIVDRRHAEILKEAEADRMIAPVMGEESPSSAGQDAG